MKRSYQRIVGACLTAAGLSAVSVVNGQDAISPALALKRAHPDTYDAAAAALAIPESLCGGNDLQLVNAYAGGLGPSSRYVQNHKTAVGAMSDDTVSGKYCSGTLVSRDLFLTASHCVDSTTVGDVVAFNFELSGGAGSARAIASNLL